MFIKINNVEMEFEGSPPNLVKINGQRPDYMSGDKLIRLVKVISNFVAGLQGQLAQKEAAETSEAGQFIACYAHAAPGGHFERSAELRYIADGPQSAITDFGRWWENRQKLDTKEHVFFGPLWAVKIYRVVPQRIDKDGYCASDTGLAIYEWKHDWGISYGMGRG